MFRGRESGGRRNPLEVSADRPREFFFSRIRLAARGESPDDQDFRRCRSLRAVLSNSHQLQSLVIITGMSGSGKHTVSKAFEDLGHFSVDNLPSSLIPRLIQMTTASGGKIEKLAVVVDIRLKESIARFIDVFPHLKRSALRSTVIFTDASDAVLARRYSETRRVHPLAANRSLLQAVREERKKLAELRALADVVVDTSEFSIHDLRNFIYENLQRADLGDHLQVSVVSFGYKYGIPFDSDLIFDVRFLPNPNFVPGLKTKTGKDPEVVEFMKSHAETSEILARLEDMLEYLLPRYSREGKAYLTISVGCTGGRHRSVMVAGNLKERLEAKRYKVNLIHRDLDRE